MARLSRDSLVQTGGLNAYAVIPKAPGKTLEYDLSSIQTAIMASWALSYAGFVHWSELDGGMIVSTLGQEDAL